MIRPWFASEKLLAGPPYRGCLVSSLWGGFAMATENESATGPDARPKGKAERTHDLQRGWTGFKHGDPGDLVPDNGDIVAICEAMFPDLPKPTIVVTEAWSVALERLHQGEALVMHLRLSALPASSPLRDYTSADHAVLIHDADNGKTRRIDPMHQHSDTYTGEWVPLEDVRIAAKAMGRFYLEVFPIGRWTAQKLATGISPSTLLAVKSQLTASKADVARLERDLAECQADSASAAEAAREALLDSLHDWETEQRGA